MTISTLTIICDIVKQYLELCDDQIWIYNQKKNIPTDSRLYVVVSYGGATPYANTKRHGGADGLKAEHAQHVQESIKIDLLSASTAAVDRVCEVLGALLSDYSQSIQERYGLQIAAKPSQIQDTSAAEVTRNLFRTTIDVKVLRAYTQLKSVAYYDQFEIETKDERGII
jgi:hypothetical protein